MFFIFGSRRSNRIMGQLPHTCVSCGRDGYHSYVRSSGWFTLFFIPVIPLGSTTVAVCNLCGWRQGVTNAYADAAFRPQPQGLPNGPR